MRPHSLWIPVVLALLAPVLMMVLSGCSTPNSEGATKWPKASELPSNPGLIDPRIRPDGTKVATVAEWQQQRRPELKRMFQHYMYGFLPPAPLHMKFHNEGIFTDFMGGRATLKLMRIETGIDNAPSIRLMLVVPNQKAKPLPVFLSMNFCGNHAIAADPRIPLTRGWIGSNCKGCVEGHATEPGRGSQAVDWPLEEIISRGYAFASFSSSDVDSDRKDVSDGIYAWLSKSWKDPALAEPAHRGTIAAWAWGFQRCVDYLVRDPDINAHQIAAVGHSRNGKTALLAAAMDERIALAIPHQAGCGGSAPSRGTIGESVQRINTVFPHWFNQEFKTFNERTDLLPIDQHCLVALCAPRPVLFSNALDDQWANPTGQFEVLQAADPIYRFLGAGGLETESIPQLGQLSPGALGYFIRPGKHSMNADDWKIFLEFTDHHFRKGR